MADLIKVPGTSIPVGSIIQCAGAPDSSWHRCDGSILNQADYPVYVAQCDDLHPMIWKDWSFIDVDQSAAGTAKYAMDRIGNTIVCVGSGSTVWISTDAGQTWSTNTGLDSGTHYCLANNGSIFVAPTYNSSTAHYSSDGVTWSSATLPSSRYWRYLSYTNGTFVLFNSSYYGSLMEYVYSSDGINWNSGTVPDSSGYCRLITNDGSKHILFAGSDGFYVHTSTDGINWSRGSYFLHGSPGMKSSYPLGMFYLNGEYTMFLNYDDYFYLRYTGSDIKETNDWTRYPMYPMNSSFNLFTRKDMAWTGNHYVIPNGYASEDGLLVGSSLDNLTFHRSVFRGCNGMVYSGDDWIVCLPTTSGWNSIVRSTGVSYNKTTQFQLPMEIVPDYPGIYSYIKMS